MCLACLPGDSDDKESACNAGDLGFEEDREEDKNRNLHLAEECFKMQSIDFGIRKEIKT